MKTVFFYFVSLLVLLSSAHAQLGVTILPAKVTGQKAVVPLSIENHLPSAIESARAAVFILDDQGKMLGQSTRWVIGGSREAKGLPPGGTNIFNFVVPLDKTVSTTNIKAKVTFTRIVLGGGKLGDVNKEVQVHATPH